MAYPRLKVASGLSACSRAAAAASASPRSRRRWRSPRTRRAAAVCRRVAPTVSRRAAAAERRLQARLFVRGRDGMRLTDAGAAFVARAADLAGRVNGMVLATALLHAAGLGFGWTLRRRGAWLPRAVGAAVALFGATLLAQIA